MVRVRRCGRVRGRVSGCFLSRVGGWANAGNPGMRAYYTEFLRALCGDAQVGGSCTALCVSSLGQDTSGVAEQGDAGPVTPEAAASTARPPTGAVRVLGTSLPYYSLQDQIEHQRTALHTLETILPPSTPIYIVGHSVGAYIATRIMQHAPSVRGVYLLFPTVSYIAQAPRARSVQYAFTTVGMLVLHGLASVVALLPFAWLVRLVAVFTRMRPEPAAVTARFVHGRGNVWNALGMGRDEMASIAAFTPETIAHLDQSKLHVRAYWGAGDTVRPAHSRRIHGHPPGTDGMPSPPFR